jgi:hypothetical protein
MQIIVGIVGLILLAVVVHVFQETSAKDKDRKATQAIKEKASKDAKKGRK